MWQGMMRAFLLSRATLPAGSSTSAVKHSSTAARYTGAPAPTRDAYLALLEEATDTAHRELQSNPARPGRVI
ncbi:unnamed protein product [Ectocarpus sp. 8 AP-2014]